MSFSSRRRNYLLTPHRRDGLIEWMKSMLMHSFVLDALNTTGADTMDHFETLIDEHRANDGDAAPSRLKQLVPTAGKFHTRLPLRKAFETYDAKYGVTKRRHVCVSFNELRHILNLAQIMEMARGGGGGGGKTKEEHDDGGEDENGNTFKGPQMITFDGDQTLYSDGNNFESNTILATYMYQLLRNGVSIAVVTAAGYEYQTEKYETRLSGLLSFFKEKGLPPADCERFYLMGGECNYLLRLGHDYKLHAVRENGPGGWLTTTRYLKESPGNWSEESVKSLLDVAEASIRLSMEEQNLRAKFIRKRRAVGIYPEINEQITREALDETILRVQADLYKSADVTLPYCAFNGGRDAWVDCGNKKVGVLILQSYLGIDMVQTLHIGDQFLNTGNDFAARDICPCVWITGPEETTYILKSILRLASVPLVLPDGLSALGMGHRLDSTNSLNSLMSKGDDKNDEDNKGSGVGAIDFKEIERRRSDVNAINVYTGEMTCQTFTSPVKNK